MKNIIIFGAGKLGIKAFLFYQERGVAFFVDNNADLWGDNHTRSSNKKYW